MIREDNSRDYEYRKEAFDFYESLVRLLNDGDVKYVHDDWVVYGEQIDGRYSDLAVAFVKGGNIEYGYGGMGDAGKAIIVKGFENPSKASSKLSKSAIIHEFIHYLDHIRKKGGKQVTSGLHPSTYFNHPFEYNAYYQEAMHLMDALSKQPVFLKFILGMGFDKFYSWCRQQVFNKDFISNISPANERRLIKRLYGFYNSIKQ